MTMDDITRRRIEAEGLRLDLKAVPARGVEAEIGKLPPFPLMEHERQWVIEAMQRPQPNLVSLGITSNKLSEPIRHLEKYLRPVRAIQQQLDRLSDLDRLSKTVAGLSAHAQRIEEYLRPIRASKDMMRGLVRDSPFWEQARRLAEMSSLVQLPATLRPFRADMESLAERLAWLHPPALAAHWTDPAVAAGLANASAFSNILDQTARVDANVIRATEEFRVAGLLGIADTTLARAVLDAGGLHLRPFNELFFPSPRILRLPPTRGDKRKALHNLRKRARPSRAHQTAHRIIGSTEGILRRVIARAMECEYGPEWEQKRLPLCGCGDLLKKAGKRGGMVLDHADWAHYRMIMCEPEHFAALFAVGFSDTFVLGQALEAVRQERAVVAHYRAFTPNNLAALRASCRALEDGLMELIHPLGLADDGDDEDFVSDG